MRKLKVLVLTFAVLGFTACSNNSHKLTEEIAQETIRADLLARKAAAIKDEMGSPVANAEVLIGPSKNTPFPNNIVTTDANGEFSVPAGWTQELPITIFKDGFIKTSYLKQTPNGQVFEIRHSKSSTKISLKGSITGFGSLPNDGFIDFGLAITSMNNQGALNFDISQLIAEEYDTISVIGQKLDIPKNVFIPKQKESYSFIPVTIEKAFYSLFFDTHGSYKVQANRGRFDFKKVADKLKAGKSFFEVVNDFEFLAMGSKTVNVNQPDTPLDFDSNQKKLAPKINFTTPAPSSGMLFGISMAEEDGKLLPADIKLREAKPQQLALPESVSRGTVLLVQADKVQKNKDEAELSKSMSTALVDSEKLAQGYLLDRIAAPTLTSSGMKLSKPSTKGNLKGFATYAALSDVKKERFQTFNLERADISWEIYSPGWVEEIDLPNVNAVRADQQWQVVFYGIDSLDNKQFNGPRTLSQATHAVHNAVQF